MESEPAAADDVLTGLDALVIISVGITGLHVGLLRCNCLVRILDTALGIPVLADGCSVEGGAGLHAEGGILVGAIRGGRVGTEVVGRSLELTEDEIPGLLLGSALGECEQLLVAGTVIVLVQRLCDDGNATEVADHHEIAVRTDETCLCDIGLGHFRGYGPHLGRCSRRLDEVVYRTDGTPVPEGLDAVHSIIRVGVEAVVTAVAVGRIQRVLVLISASVHGDIGVHLCKEHLDTGFGGSHVLAGHLGQVTLETVKEFLAGGQRQGEGCKCGKYV